MRGAGSRSAERQHAQVCGGAGVRPLAVGATGGDDERGWRWRPAAGTGGNVLSVPGSTCSLPVERQLAPLRSRADGTAYTMIEAAHRTGPARGNAYNFSCLLPHTIGVHVEVAFAGHPPGVRPPLLGRAPLWAAEQRVCPGRTFASARVKVGGREGQGEPWPTSTEGASFTRANIPPVIPLGCSAPPPRLSSKKRHTRALRSFGTRRP